MTAKLSGIYTPAWLVSKLAPCSPPQVTSRPYLLVFYIKGKGYITQNQGSLAPFQRSLPRIWIDWRESEVQHCWGWGWGVPVSSVCFIFLVANHLFPNNPKVRMHRVEGARATFPKVPVGPHIYQMLTHDYRYFHEYLCNEHSFWAGAPYSL